MKRMTPVAINAEATSVIRMLIMRCGANNLNKLSLVIRRKVLAERCGHDNIKDSVDGSKS
jgi:hypothetical protein